MPTKAHEHAREAECRCPACLGLHCLDRPNFFTGQLLTEAELNGEQAYVLAKNRLHNRYLHGWGVVCGLHVECNECAGWVTIGRGYAIDACGEDVVVCEETPFDVVGAIEACKAKERRPPEDCDPLLPANDPDCDDAEQEWCITISYEETPVRPLSSLRYEPRASAHGADVACSCGGTVRAHSGGANGCGCGRSTGVASSATSAAVRTATQSAALACEPTRTREGFRLGVVRRQTYRRGDDREGPPAGSFAAAAAACGDEVETLLAKAPPFEKLENASAQELYAACCAYRALVLDFFRAAPTTNCALLDRLAEARCPQPPDQLRTRQPDEERLAARRENVRGAVALDPAVYRGQVQEVVSELKTLVAVHALDCICLALMPPCPADPTEQRLVLACVTVRDGRIVRICHGDGRKQLLGFPALEYAFAGQPAQVVLPLLAGLLNGTLGKLTELLCCGKLGEVGQLAALVGRMFRGYSAKMAMATPAATMAATFAQAAGTETLATLAPEEAPELVDTRRLVGRRVAAVESELRSRRIEVAAEAVDPVPEAMLAVEPSLAALPADQPLTMYTRGDVVVGVAPTDEAATLRAELAALHARVAELEGR